MKYFDIFDGEFIDRLSRIGGLRNILVHEYTTIERENIIESAKDLFNDFPLFMTKILDDIKQNDVANI